MSWLDRMKERLEAAQESRQRQHQFERAAGEGTAYEQRHHDWQVRDAELAETVTFAETYAGESGPDVPILLRRNETAYLIGRGVGLIEPRRPPGHFEGGSQGVSFRVMRGVSYRVGQSRGHFVQESERPTVIDQGAITVTNQRVVFQGATTVREWHFAKLIGVSHNDDPPWTALQVSNRQKISGFLYDQENAERIRLRLALALAHYREELPAFLADLRQERAEHAGLEPRPPVSRPAELSE